MPAPTATTASASTEFCSPLPSTNSRPEATEPIASRIIGPVITAGASCGWVSGAHRRSPKNVISMTRVM
ncbi:Uncharacterised protein [Mycobacteroides abscessus subsp. abscessus]|nr:Uncharacterised protein [Mycobacteroides abscessus subsp. abscessus]